MKIKIYFSVLFLTLSLLSLNSCKERVLDTPPFHIPEADVSDGTVITVAELINLAPNLPSPGIFLIDSNYYVKGVITGNDESGNIYKKLYIQDSTAAIAISIDAKTMYLKYRVGQTVYLKCKGMYLGNSYGIYQFGSIYNGGPGRITLSDSLLIEDVIMQDGLPDLESVPEPKTVEGVTGLSLTEDISKLVKVTNVSFVDAGVKLYANAGESYPERTIKDMNGNTMVLSNSSYATFAKDTLPIGSGDITGILGLYNGEFRLVIRDLNDIQFYEPILSELFASDPSTWTKTNVSGTGVWAFNSTDKCMKISGWVSGDAAANEDWLISPAFDISSAENPILTFSSRRRFNDTETEPMTVYITTNYTGDVSTTTWSKLSPALDTNTADSFTGWVVSGDVNLSAYTGSNVRIAFKYKSSSNTNGTASYWDIDNISVIDK